MSVGVVALSVWFAALGVVLLAGCDDGAPDYRYRLTVEVETPEGLKTGSSVIEVEQNLGRAGGSPANSQIYRKVRGEAVAVDMPDGRTLFALLRSESDNEWAETVMDRVSPPSRRGSDGPLFDGPLQLKGEVDVPRTYPAYAWLEERSAYPMLVTFGDIDDPTSVEEVDPDDLAATFGEGVVLKRVTVELTNDPVTTGIEERLVWLSAVGFSRGSLVGNPPKYLSDAKPIDRVSPSDFSTELYE